jgi:hypothetical protein
MKLHQTAFPFTLLTPCFSGTALGKLDEYAEMRIPPIRGHVRFWHRSLFGADDANNVWGNANGNNGNASTVGLRFSGAISKMLQDPDPDVLPHSDNKRGSRPALAADEQFKLHLQRLVGCQNGYWERAHCAVKLWLLVGSLGLRSNRAAGSVWPCDAWTPRNENELLTTLQQLGLKNWDVAFIGLGAGMNYEELRESASDTVKGKSNASIFGCSDPRMPSPAKFKVIKLQQGYCLLAIAPHPELNDGMRHTLLKGAEILLSTKCDPKRWKKLGLWKHFHFNSGGNPIPV